MELAESNNRSKERLSAASHSFPLHVFCSPYACTDPSSIDVTTAIIAVTIAIDV
jgi:hypothetical protein